MMKQSMTVQPPGKFPLMVGLAIIIAFIGYRLLTAPYQDNPVRTLGNTTGQSPSVPDKPARELKGHTPDERINNTGTEAINAGKKAAEQP